MWTVTWLALTVAAVTGGQAAVLVNNGYEGLVVAISPSLPEDQAPAIIEGIKNAVTEASQDLFRVTRWRAYFRYVRILLPKTWTNTSFDEVALNENFEDSEIRVDLRNPVYGDQPYTLQPGGCGDPGQYIHLTSEYLTDDAAAAKWSPRGKALVHEWAKFRWGVFDEFGYAGDPQYPYFYPAYKFTPNVGYEMVATPNYCANTELQGEYRDALTGGQCSFVNGAPDENCLFQPYIDQPVNSSFMGYYYMDNMKDFCDSASNEQFVHNHEAPNKHNSQCNSRSVWEVVVQHPDFSDGANPPTENSKTPEFTVLGQEEAKFVLDLDYSGSMNDFDRINKLRRTAQRWILYDVADGSYVGIVRFNDKATKIADLTEISNTTRQSLADLIQTNANGGTSIGAGLRLAISDPGLLLDRNNGVILLVTDGENTAGEDIHDVMDDVVASGVRVVTVAFGEKADPNLESLAENTGGKTYMVLDEDNGTALNDAFQGSLTYQPPDSVTDITVKIHESDYSGHSTNYSDAFDVDSTVGRNLQFRLNAASPSDVTSDPELRDPNGTLYTTTHKDPSLNLWITDVPLGQVGRWTWSVALSGGQQQRIQVVVTSQARDPDGGPIHTLAWMNAGAQGGFNASASPLVVYAEVMQGQKPVVGAHVRAYITQPNSIAPAVEMDLLDNGQGADTTGGDGIYSRYFTNYTNTGRYSVTAQVWDDGSSYINNGFIVSRQNQELPPMFGPALFRVLLADSTGLRNYCCGSSIPFDPTTATPTGAFRRSAPGGTVMVTEVPPPGRDPFPPSRVTDLRTTATNNSLVLNLTWTAPGDNLDTGTVAGYEIRLSQNRTKLSEELFDADDNTLLLSFNDSQQLNELLQEAGQQVEVQLEVKDELEDGEVYFVALIAMDGSNNRSPVSNVAAGQAELKAKNTRLPVWAIVLISCVCVALIPLAAFAGFKWGKKKSQQEASESQETIHSGSGSPDPPRPQPDESAPTTPASDTPASNHVYENSASDEAATKDVTSL